MIPNIPLNERLISVVMERAPEIMNKLTGLLRRRGFNTLGISAGNAKQKELLRLTVHLRGDDRCVEQAQKQINKITETVKVAAIDPCHHVQSEVALIKVRCNEDDRDALVRLAGKFNGRAVDASEGGVIFELTGKSGAIESFIEKLDSRAVVEIARSGIVAMDSLGLEMKSLRPCTARN